MERERADHCFFFGGFCSSFSVSHSPFLLRLSFFGGGAGNLPMEEKKGRMLGKRDWPRVRGNGRYSGRDLSRGRDEHVACGREERTDA